MSTSIHEATPLQLAEHMRHRQRMERIADRAIDRPLPRPEPVPMVTLPDIYALPVVDPTPIPPEAVRVPWDGDRLTVEKIKRAVADAYKISRVDIDSQRRSVLVVRPRQVTYYLAKKITGRSLPEIGRRVGGRDHTTVMSGIKKIERLMAADPELADQVQAIRESLTGAAS